MGHRENNRAEEPFCWIRPSDATVSYGKQEPKLENDEV